jgi:hypothetical protein
MDWSAVGGLSFWRGGVANQRHSVLGDARTSERKNENSAIQPMTQNSLNKIALGQEGLQNNSDISKIY